MFSKGQRVMVKVMGAAAEPGTVIYVRMAAPDYSKVEAVSVSLDRYKDRPGYTGHVVHVSHVSAMSAGGK